MKRFAQREYGDAKIAGCIHMRLAVSWTDRCVGDETVHVRIKNSSLTRWRRMSSMLLFLVGAQTFSAAIIAVLLSICKDSSEYGYARQLAAWFWLNGPVFECNI